MLSLVKERGYQGKIHKVLLLELPSFVLKTTTTTTEAIWYIKIWYNYIIWYNGIIW